jgi:hypothetical protein
VDRSVDDRDPFFNAAVSISDGAEIDWKDVGRGAIDEETTAILVQLQVVEQIARVHSAPRASSKVRIESGSKVQGPRSRFWSRFTGAKPNR